MTKAAADLRIALGRLAEHFEKSAQPVNGTGRGWGQFLDAPKNHIQVGPYGTCAGIITLTLAGRGESPICREAAHALRNWWLQRPDKVYSQKRFAQTLRLAFINLAVRISTISELQSLTLEIERELISHSLKSGGWGDWWLNADRYDPTPSTFTSSICLLSILLFRTTPIPDDVLPQLTNSVNWLRGFLKSPGRMSDLDLLAVTSAICIWDSSALAASGKGVPLTWRNLPEHRHGIYFFFYEHEPDLEGRSFGRDYLLVPLEALIAITGFSKAAKASLRLTAEELLPDIVENLDSNEGLYRLGKRDHISTIDQSWVAIALASAINSQELALSPPGLWSRAWHSLKKNREDNLFTGTILPLFTVIFFTVINSLPWVESPTLKVLISFGTVLVGALYGDNILRRLIRGRG